jgi:orotate phosphoribosyltransferase
MAILQQYSVTVSDMFISVDRCEKGYNGKTAVAEVMEEFGIKVHSIVTVRDILAYMENAHMPMIDELRAYMEQYCIL